jgi:hypothetical protein
MAGVYMFDETTQPNSDSANKQDLKSLYSQIVEERRQLPQIVLPKVNRPESRFAAEMGKAIGPSNVLFRYQAEVVELIDEPFTGELDENKLAIGGLKFGVLSPTRARTWVEDHVTTGVNLQIKDGDGKPTGESRFVPCSMKQTMANGLLVSPQFAKHIPVIHRILDVPIPIRTRNGTIVRPVHGFNKSLGIYCNPNSPRIKPLPLEDARKILDKTLEGFTWKNDQSRVHAIARLFTPYGRGLMGFSARTPLWFYIGNRPRAGKDYLAGVTQIVYLGHVFEDAALGEDSEETRKRITTAIVSGRRMMHWANCQGFIQSAPFIQSITAKVWRTRALGSTSAKSDLELPNEIDYSLSANVGITHREDVEGRMRKIELAFYDEDENSRIFPNPFLHEWVTDNRGLILSAIAAFFEHWIKEKMPPGQTPFNSFPEWASVIGGVMQSCELGDPCLPHEDKDLVGGDQKAIAMRALYSLEFEQNPGVWLSKKDVYALIAENQENDEALHWFGDFSGKRKEASMKTGKALSSFQNRIINGVALRIDTSEATSQRHKVKFETAV